MSYLTVKLENDHRSKKEGSRTRDLRDTGAMLYQLSYEATHLERGQFIEFISSREEWNDVRHIWNNSYLNCGGRWKGKMIITVDPKHVTRYMLLAILARVFTWSDRFLGRCTSFWNDMALRGKIWLNCGTTWIGDLTGNESTVYVKSQTSFSCFSLSK